MPNTNWLKGLACPRCGSPGPFYVDTLLTLTVTDDGPVAYDQDNAAWGPQSGCVCPACGQSGCVADFTKKEPAGRRRAGPCHQEKPMTATTIYVALYEHEYGTDTHVCASEAEALALREDLARENWSQELPDDPMPETGVGEAYFELMAEKWSDAEYFNIHPLVCDLSCFQEAAPSPPAAVSAADGEEVAVLQAQYAARGLLLFQPGAGTTPSGAPWALTRRDRLTGMLYRDWATFRDVDFAARLFADQERLAGLPA